MIRRLILCGLLGLLLLGGDARAEAPQTNAPVKFQPHRRRATRPMVRFRLPTWPKRKPAPRR